MWLQCASLGHSSLLLDEWRRHLEAALDEEQQRSLYVAAAASTVAAVQETAVTLGLSSRFASLREDAAFALLDRISQPHSNSAAMRGVGEDASLLTALATSDQLPLFVRSHALFPQLTDTLARLSKAASSPFPAAAAVSSTMHRVFRCPAFEKEVQLLYPVVEDSLVARGWSLPLSLAYLVAKGFHSEAVAVLFDELQMQPSFRSTEVGLELVRAHLTDGMKKVSKEGNSAALDAYQSALQLMDAESLGKPAKSGSKPIAQPVKAVKKR